MSKILLDASALLALFKREPGADEVEAALVEGVLISAVNWSETLAKLVEVGIGLADASNALDRLQLGMLPFERIHAQLCAELRESTRRAGLSFADRACLATAKVEGVTVLTADRAWASLDLGTAIRVIR